MRMKSLLGFKLEAVLLKRSKMLPGSVEDTLGVRWVACVQVPARLGTPGHQCALCAHPESVWSVRSGVGKGWEVLEDK